MTPKEFVERYKADALKCFHEKGFHPVAILAQAALESNWGKAAPGNMFFGVKDTDGVNGNEQLLITTEYSRRADAKFPVVISVTPVVMNGVKMFKYKIKDYFRKYNTPADCFADHCRFFERNPRYKKALTVRGDYERFFEEIARAGYATDPNYSNSLKTRAKTIEQFL